MNAFSAPGKIILFGEWAVLDGRSAVGIAVDARFRAELEVRDAKTVARPFAGRLAVHSEKKSDLSAGVVKVSKTPTLAWYSTHALPPAPYFELVFKILAQLEANNPVEFHARWADGQLYLDRGWLLAEGLGSSSALFLLLKALDRQQPITASDYAQLRAEMLLLQDGRGSGFDLAIQLLGGTVMMTDFIPQRVDLPLPKNVRFLHTGEKYSTAFLLKTHGENKGGPTVQHRQQLGEICEDFLKDSDWLKAVENSYKVLAEIGLVPISVQQLKNEWQAQGLIEGLKTCGAGGGDTLLTLVNESRILELEAVCAKQGWWISDHKFPAEGLSAAL